MKIVRREYRWTLLCSLSGDTLVFLNEKNVLQPPIALTLDRIKSEVTALRRHNQSIRLGICRSKDRALLNNTTVQHLGAFTFEEFQQISLDEQLTPSLNGSRKSLPIQEKGNTAGSEPKRLASFFSNKKKSAVEQQNKQLVHKRSTSPNRDSGFIETDGQWLMIVMQEERQSLVSGTNTSMLTDRSVNSTSNKRRSKTSLEKSDGGSIDTHKSLDSLQRSSTKIHHTVVEPTHDVPNKQANHM